MKLRIFFIASLFCVSSNSIAAEPATVITVSLTGKLSDVTRRLDSELPSVLHSAGPRREICVPAERACTKIPEFRGLKIYSRMECIDVSPRISCDVSEKVTRAGQLLLSGKGSTISAEEVVSGSATARGRGAIGRNIRQTVRGSARVFASAEISVAADWTPNVNLSVNHRWERRPSVNLFGTIPISLGSEADRAIAKVKPDLQRKLPEMLAGIGLRQKVDALWQSVQEPLQIVIDGSDVSLFAHIRPDAVSFSGLDFSGDQLSATARIQATTRLVDTKESPWGAPTALPNLGPLATDANGFNLQVPVSVGYGALNSFLASGLPITQPLDFLGIKTMRVADAQLSGTAGRLVVETKLSLFGEDQNKPKYEETATFSARPVWSSQTNALALDDFRLDGGLNIILRAGFKAAQFTGLIERTFTVPLDGVLNSARDGLTSAINLPLDENLALRGNVTGLAINSLAISDTSVTSAVSATGDLGVTLNLSK